MQLVILTGLSGAGKATAAKVFEDLAYTVTDNLPPALLPDLVDRSLATGGHASEQRLAVVTDSRAGNSFSDLGPALEAVRSRGIRPILLFLDASDPVLVQRFKETRRRHPLYDEHGGILGSLRAERDLLEGVREAADQVIDTSDLSVQALRETLVAEFAAERDKNQGLTITVSSFGFKYGLPLDADLVFDVRFLINPHYVDALRALNGRDAQVQAYVATDEALVPYLDKLYDLMAFTLPRYIAEGKAYLMVAIGCTGGQHRSVMISEKLAEFLRGQGYRVLVQHRDVKR
jgi:UPF0042 nucleotide-binding protein